MFSFNKKNIKTSKGFKYDEYLTKLFLPFLYSLLEEGLGDDGKDMLEEKTFNFFSFLLVSGGGGVVVTFGWEGDPV